jgi:hypothetical protein
MRPRRAHPVSYPFPAKVMITKRNTSAPTRTTASDARTPLFERLKLPVNFKDVTTQKLGTTYTVVGYVQTDRAQD